MIPIKGVVLAGGQSSRLGRDKALLRLEEHGPTLLDQAAQTLRELGLEVVISVRQQRPELAYPQIEDSYLARDSMCALASCLKQLAAPCLFIPCDMPLLRPAFLRRLLEARQSAPPGTVLTMFREPESGFMQPLTAIYEPGSLPCLERAISFGNYMLFRAIPVEQTVFVDYDSNEAVYFLNINTQQDLRVCLHHLQKSI